MYDDVGFQLLGIDNEEWWATFKPKARPQDILCRIENGLWLVLYVTEFVVGHVKSTRACTFRGVELEMEIGSLSLGSYPNIKNEEATPNTNGYKTTNDVSI